ncbi:MAG: hypothetical protein ACLTS6_04540 [Anaerobutyricum sp.]
MKPEDFDQIITGDLGSVGQKLLFELLDENHKDIKKNHMDCGMQIFDAGSQDTHAGGSGCACSALMLISSDIAETSQWRMEKECCLYRTGALLSQVSANEGETIPANCTMQSG